MTGVLGAAAVRVSAAAPVAGALPAPASKSLTNRALLVAALAAGVSRLHVPLASDDTDAMVRAVRGLGAVVSSEAGDLVVEGTGGQLHATSAPIDAGLSGTTMRFAVAAGAVGQQLLEFTGEPPLLRRPIGPLTAALRSLGATVEDGDGYPPVRVRGPLAGGDVTVDVAASSQFLSAVLMAAPYAAADVVATPRGEAADAYIAMTADLMNRWGAEVTNTDGAWHVRSRRTYGARSETVEYDASAAAHLFALAAASQGSITVTNVAPSTLQPDARIVDVLAAMGCTIREEEGAVSVQGPPRLRAVDVDLHAMPDQLPAVAVLAALADGVCTITGAAVTRGHETDRIAAVATELRKVGADVVEHADGMTVAGGATLAPARLRTYNDHRLAMSFAALALAVDGVVIEEPGCVAKTYPGFFDDLQAVGAVVQSTA